MSDSIKMFPHGKNMHDKPVWVVKEKSTEVARVVERDDGRYNLIWMGKWADIYANNTFDTPLETLDWVIAIIAMARAKKNPNVVKGKGIRFTGASQRLR